MKTMSRMRIGGSRRRPGDRNAFRLWLNGSGTCDWNWASTWLRRSCVPRNVPRPTWFRARVKTVSEDGLRGEGSGGEEERLLSTVSRRIRASHARRRPQRGQSRQSTGAEGSAAGAGSGSGETSEGEEKSGRSTALTRRGVSVVGRSWHWARKEHDRPSPMRAADQTRSEPVSSGRRS